MDLDIEYKLSLYEDVKIIYNSKKSNIFLVQSSIDDKFYIKRILKEYTIDVYTELKNIKHKNLPKIKDIFELDDKLYIIEEFINGYTLQEIIEKEGKLDEKLVVKYIISLCDILNTIHTLNPPIIHRDIKPANIIISNDGVLKLIDFDISRIYKEGESLDTTLLGTKGYASPEQFGFDQTDCRSDIYAIGVMINVLCTGKHIKEELSTGILKNIIIKCTKISAEDRYQNIEELRRELNCIFKNNIKENSNVKIEYQTKKDKATENKKWYKYIPGFRKNNKFFMIIATIWYLFLSTGLIISTNLMEFLSNLSVVSMLLILWLLYTNFLNIKNYLPMLKNKKIYIQVIGYIAYTIIIELVFGGILVSIG